MIRKIATGLMLSAFAGALVIGCGKADLSEGQANWTKRSEEVKAKLAEVQNAHASLMQSHQSMQAADMTDENKAKYEQAGQMLSAEETTLQSVSEALVAQDSALSTAVATGDQAAFDEAWSAASKSYDEAVTKLESVQANLNNIQTLAASMSTPAGDTAAADAGETTDTKTPAAEEKTGDTAKN